jgi:hypothetical protein
MPSDSPDTTAPTRLARALREPRARRAAPVDLFRLARRLWLKGERVDIGALAGDLGIGRATAFRWVGSRELLLGEILWSLCEQLMKQADAAATELHGPARIAAVCARAVQAMVAFAPLRRYVQQEPEAALKLLTSRHGPVQARTIAYVETLLTREAAAGALTPALPVATLAWLIVRIGESFVYSEVVSDRRPDPADAALAIALLLSGRLPEGLPADLLPLSLTRSPE